MDGACGGGVDSGLYGNQLRLLRLLIGAEGSAGDLTSSTKLSRHRFRPRQGSWLVFRAGAYLPSSPTGSPPHRRHRPRCLRRSVARHHVSHLPPLLTCKQARPFIFLSHYYFYLLKKKKIDKPQKKIFYSFSYFNIHKFYLFFLLLKN